MPFNIEIINKSKTLAPKSPEPWKQHTNNIVNVILPFSFWSGKPDTAGKLNTHFICKRNHTKN